MTNPEIARALADLATMLELDGANPFRVRAYREASRIVAAEGEPMAALAGEEGRLESIRGIGKDLAQKIRELATTGRTALHDELSARIPVEVVRFTDLQGLGPKRVKTLFETLGIRTREALGRAAKDGKLRDLPGFGETVERNVLRALATSEQFVGRTRLAVAWPVAHALADHVRAVRGVRQVEIAGSFRRRRDTVGDLDLLATGGKPEDVMEAFTGHPDVVQVLGRGDTKSSVQLRQGLQVDLRLVPAESFGAALLYFTGSKEHNIELRRIAIERGMSLNEYGLTKGKRRVAGRTEEEVYRALDLDWIPPELREARGEVALAREGRLPKLIEETDLVADLHMHTTRSDGRDTIEAMVKAAIDRGYKYCAITEHSKSLTVANGFDEARVRRSVGEIEAARGKFPQIAILHGLEVDILADGALDLEEDGLALLDWVIVSLHSRLDQPGPIVTERVLRALAHPRVHAMAHPSGRLIGSREPAAFDAERVFERAAELGVAMEINAQPDRLDLTDVHARLARSKGVKIVIDTDAHATRQLDNIRYGVYVARRAGLTRDDVLNTLPLERFRKALRRPGGKPASPAAHAAKPEAGGKAAQAGPLKKAPAGRKKAAGTGPAKRATAASRPRRRKAAGSSSGRPGSVGRGTRKAPKRSK